MGKESREKGIAFNVSMLYIMNIAKLVFPLITLPFLTRVLTVEGYGIVSYVKATMVYAQLIVDFGFMLSGVKAIAEIREDRNRLNRAVGNVVLAKGLLCVASFVVIMVAAIFIPILRENMLYTILAFIPVALSTLLLDFLFRGIEQMQIITIRYVVMKTISVGLTLAIVRSDADILWIPVLDILSSVIAIVLVMWEVKKLGISISFADGIKGAVASLRTSSIYFISEAATTVFGAFNTILIGIFMSKADVAYWAVCLQLVSAVKAMYTPITNGIYPQMIKKKNFTVITKCLKLFMPIVIAGCLVVLFGAKYILVIAGSSKYAAAAPTMRCLVPVLLFSFPAMLFGWPTLGALNKVADTTKTTIAAAVVQIAGLALLGLTGHFSIVAVALLKSFTEISLMSFRLGYIWKYRDEIKDFGSFKDEEEEKVNYLQWLYMLVLNTLFKLTGRLSDRARDALFCICTCLMAFVCMYFNYLEKVGFGYMELFVVNGLLLCFVILFSVDRVLKPVVWNKWLFLAWFVAGICIMLPIPDMVGRATFIVFGMIISFVFPALVFVWNNRGEYDKLYRYVAWAVVAATAAFFILNILESPYIANEAYMGITSNSNSIGIAGIGGAIAALALLCTEKKWKWVCIVFFGLDMTFVLLSESRASLLAIIFAFLAYLVIKIRDHRKAVAIVIEVALIVISCTVMFVGVKAIMSVEKPYVYNAVLAKEKEEGEAYKSYTGITEGVSEEASVVEKFQRGDGDADSYSSGRISTWKYYITHIGIIGHSRSEGNPYIKERGVTSSAHNSYLEIGYRSGIVPGLLYAGVAIYAAVWVFMYLFGKKRKFTTAFALVAMAVLAFGVMSNLERALYPVEKVHILLYYFALIPMFEAKEKK